MKLYRIFIPMLVLLISTSTTFSQSLTIATWNIEHLGSGGRGFPELVGNNKLSDRTPDDYKEIAIFIRDSLSLEIVGVQEIASSRKEGDKSYSNELTTITTELGTSWKYYLANFKGGGNSENEMQNAFIYNSDKVELKTVFELDVPKYDIGEDAAFDRKPLVGYFVPKGSQDGFVVVNLHLASKQDNDENHMAAMIMVEQNLSKALAKQGITNESDIIILGDFNDNPFAKKSNGECCKYSDLMYQYMAQKGYVDLVDASFGTTRMNDALTSIIDHILISKGAKTHVTQTKASIYKPKDMSVAGLKKWRTVYSDHFPIYFEYR